MIIFDLAIPIAFAYFKLYQLVSHTSIEVQRLEANFRSSVCRIFRSTKWCEPFVRLVNHEDS